MLVSRMVAELEGEQQASATPSLHGEHVDPDLHHSALSLSPSHRGPPPPPQSPAAMAAAAASATSAAPPPLPPHSPSPANHYADYEGEQQPEFEQEDEPFQAATQCLDLLADFTGKLRLAGDYRSTDNDDLVEQLTDVLYDVDSRKVLDDLDVLEAFVTVWQRAAERFGKVRHCECSFMNLPSLTTASLYSQEIQPPVALMSAEEEVHEASQAAKGKAPIRASETPLPVPSEGYFADHNPTVAAPTMAFPEVPAGFSPPTFINDIAGSSSSSAQAVLLDAHVHEEGRDDPRVHTCYHEVVADPQDDMAINIKLMDRVRLEIEMDDGITGIGTNLNTGAMGSFPLTCLAVPSDVDTRPHDESVAGLYSSLGAPNLPAAAVPDRGFADAHIPLFAANHIVDSPLVETTAKTSAPTVPAGHAQSGSSANQPLGTSRANSIASATSVSSPRPMDDEVGLPTRGASLNQHRNQNPLLTHTSSTPPTTPPTGPAPPRLEHQNSRDSKIGYPLPGGSGTNGSNGSSPTQAVRPPFTRELSEQVLEKRKFARQVIAELLDTERNFRDGMQVLIDQFMLPLGQACISSVSTPSGHHSGSSKNQDQSSFDSEHVLTRMEHKVLFHNVPGLRNLSRKICGLLEAAMGQAESDQQGLTSGGAVGAVVDVFLLNVEFEEWSTYVRYMEGFAHGKNTYNNLKKRDAFVAMLQKCESAKECNRHGFDHYQILPVQRIGRYHLLLGRLKQVTDEEDPVHHSIETAEQYMKQIGDVLEAVQKQEEEMRKIFTVFDEIKGCPPDIISASRRRLLSSFEVEELYSGRTLRMHVFSDCFLLSHDSRAPPYVVPITFGKLSPPSSASNSSTALNSQASNHSLRGTAGNRSLVNLHAESGSSGNSLLNRNSGSFSGKGNATRRAASHYAYGTSNGGGNGNGSGTSGGERGLGIVASALLHPGSGGGKDKDKDAVKNVSRHKFVFIVRVLLRDVEVQSVRGGEEVVPSGGNGGAPAGTPHHKDRVVVLRHAPGSGQATLPRVPSNASASSSHTLGGPPSPRSSQNLDDQGYNDGTGSGQGRGSFDARRGSAVQSSGASSSPSLNAGSQEKPLQELYAFRAKDSKSMAGLLAALGLAGVRV
ncbi:hypothetical protein HKX48_005602 [Thoreauomyces humboldtii]|nr:hypothetical protein HKX48_005602 [Thoreauomyces humboldtii]